MSLFYGSLWHVGSIPFFNPHILFLCSLIDVFKFLSYYFILINLIYIILYGFLLNFYCKNFCADLPFCLIFWFYLLLLFSLILFFFVFALIISHLVSWPKDYLDLIFLCQKFLNWSSLISYDNLLSELGGLLLL